MPLTLRKISDTRFRISTHVHSLCAGNVPCLVVKDADGKTVLNLSEGAAVLQWIADNA